MRNLADKIMPPIYKANFNRRNGAEDKALKC